MENGNSEHELLILMIPLLNYKTENKMQKITAKYRTEKRLNKRLLAVSNIHLFVHLRVILIFSIFFVKQIYLKHHMHPDNQQR